MYGKLLFEIPVYRVSFDRYVSEMEEEKSAHMSGVEESYDTHFATFNADPKLRDDELARASGFFDQWRWYSWHYNEVIGWIRLNGHWDVIKADYHFATQKRIVRSAKQRSFAWRGKTLELWLHDSTSEEIYRQLLDEFRDLEKEPPFKGRYIDLEAFTNVGPFIDWKNAVIE
jgi:hypothetical protein